MRKEFLRVSIALAVLCFSIIGFSQSNKEAKEAEKARKFYLREAEYLFDIKDYRSAAMVYGHLDSLFPNNPDYVYKIGESRYLSRNPITSIDYFLKAQALGFYDTKLSFYLGRAYHMSHDFSQAIRYYTRYKKFLNSKDDEEIIEEVDNYLRQCNIGVEMVNNPLELEIKNIGREINSEFADYVPLVDSSESIMVFTSRRKGGFSDIIEPSTGLYYEDIYKAYKQEDGSWGVAENLGKKINSRYHDACVSLSHDGKKIYLYKSGYKKDEVGIYTTEFKKNEEGRLEWSEPEKIVEAFINDNKNHVPSVSISAHEDAIYFSSDRKDGYGGLDIYVSKLTENGTWSEPENMGPTINTEFDEDAPFIHQSEELLFFSSKGHTSMGGYDVFFTVVDSAYEDGWSMPVNFGYPVNTAQDDIYFDWSADESKGYYASFRSDSYGEKDIYMAIRPEGRADMTILKGYVSDANTGEPIKALVLVTDPETKEVVDKSVTDSTGRYTSTVKVGEEYALLIEAEGYLFEEKTVKIKDGHGYYEVTENIDAKPYGRKNMDDTLVVSDFSSQIDDSVEEGDYDVVNRQMTVEVPEMNVMVSELDSDVYKIDENVIAITQPIEVSDGIIIKPGEYVYNSVTNQFLVENQVINLTDNQIKDSYAVLGDQLVLKERVKRGPVVLNPGQYKLTEDNLIINKDGQQHEIAASEFQGHEVGDRFIVSKKEVDGKVQTTSQIQKIIRNGELKTFKEAVEEINAYNESLALQEGNRIVFRNVYFDFNSSQLKNESIESLDKVSEVFIDNPDVKIEISGHTDNVGKKRYNRRLSKKRAKAVAGYLIKEKGIDRKRFAVVGYGENKPYVSNKTELERSLNRRTEFKVVDKDEKYGDAEVKTEDLLEDLKVKSYSPEELAALHKSHVRENIEAITGQILQWKVHFPYGEHQKITSYSQNKLRYVIQYLNLNPDKKLVIHAHADPLGTHEVNKNISEWRGNTVFDYLIEHGVDPNRLEIAAYGADVVLVDSEDKAENVRNRRVEFEVQQ